MKNLNHKSLQFQIENLIPILELWVSLLEETNKAKKNLEELPAHLEYLKEQTNAAKLNKSRISISSVSHPSKTDELESQKVDFIKTLMSDLEAKLPQLITLDHKINNLVALRERLEALQERELEPIPNHLDELIRLQNNTDIVEKQDSYKYRFQQMIDKHKHKDWRIGITIVVSVIISWGTAFTVVNNYKKEANSLTEKTEKLEMRLQKLESDAALDGQ